MQYGAHLPLIDFTGKGFSLGLLTEYARTAGRLGFAALGMNDHLAFPRPWLDGPTALAAMLEHSGRMQLFTTVGLPVVRGPAAFAKTLAALDVLSGGRVVAALGPGSEEALRGAFADYYGGDPARLEARLARANLSTPEAIREAVVLHRDLGTDELILKPATLAPDQFERLTDAVAKS